MVEARRFSAREQDRVHRRRRRPPIWAAVPMAVPRGGVQRRGASDPVGIWAAAAPTGVGRRRRVGRGEADRDPSTLCRRGALKFFQRVLWRCPRRPFRPGRGVAVMIRRRARARSADRADEPFGVGTETGRPSRLRLTPRRERGCPRASASRRACTFLGGLSVFSARSDRAAGLLDPTGRDVMASSARGRSVSAPRCRRPASDARFRRRSEPSASRRRHGRG